MVAVARSQAQAVRFRTELAPRSGSWVVVAIVYSLSFAMLFLLVHFLSIFEQYADLVGTLSESSRPEVRDAVVRANELQFEVRARAVLLGTLVLIAVTVGGVLFLRRYRYFERLLAQRTTEIEEIDQSRRLFFAKASHELRTPVTAIMGEAEVALADNHHDQRAMQEALGHIVAHAKFLGHRIEEMIGLAQTSDGKLHLDAAKLDFRDVVTEAVDESRSFARSVEVRLEVAIPERPVLVVGDRLWLKRALLAVIENALKFSPMEGTVTIELIEKEDLAQVVVVDQGPGIVPHELPLIFEAYYQTSTGKDRGGSGLGLAMTRWVAEQHGGNTFARNLGHYSRPAGCAVAIAIKREQSA